jgi:lysophospholipase L1-like esterase
MVAPSREVSDWLREVDLRKQGEKMSSRWQFAERHPLMSNLILMTVAVITTILAVDLTAFYLLGMRRVGHGPERFFQYSSLLGWQHKPNAEGIWYAYKDGTKTFVRVNSFGYPDSQREVLKERPRIALIGDSTTEFWEVEEERRGQFVLEGRLNGEVEVLNFGLRGAGTDQIYLRLGQQVQYFSPDIVIYTFCVNDIGNNDTEAGKPYFVVDRQAPHGIAVRGYPIQQEKVSHAAWPRSMLEQSFTLRKLKHFVVGITPHLRSDQPLEEHYELRPFKRTYNSEDESRMELLRRLIGAMSGDARAMGARFLLVEGIYRPALDDDMRRQVLDAYGDLFDFDRVSSSLEGIASEFGVEFLSLQRLVTERGLDANTLMHREDTMHLNRNGVEFYADAVADRISQLGWIDEVRVTSLDGKP